MHLFAFSVAALIGYSSRMQDDNWTPSFKHLNFIYIFSANRGEKSIFIAENGTLDGIWYKNVLVFKILNFYVFLNYANR